MTSAGLYDDSLPAPKSTLISLLKDTNGVIDVIYRRTPFLKMAQDLGIQTKDGSDMLIYQGAIAFDFPQITNIGLDEG